MNGKMENKKIENSGFTLLVAIVTTSMLLIVSFVVVNVALKQLTLSYSSQESQYAFYNADSGTECAIYWDLKNPPGPSAFATSTTSTISCYTMLNKVVGGGGSANATSTFTINYPKGCVTVQVGKGNDGSTMVVSRGYNTCSAGAPRRFERGITLRYYQ